MLQLPLIAEIATKRKLRGWELCNIRLQPIAGLVIARVAILVIKGLWLGKVAPRQAVISQGGRMVLHT